MGNQFMYTKEAIELVERYYQTWPRVFEFLSNSNLHNNDAIFETTLFPGEAAGKLAELARWLKEQPHSSAERQSCGVKTLETDTLKSIIGAVSALKKLPKKRLTLRAKPHLLYMPGMNDNRIAPDESADFDLFDRVVMAKESHSVPLGYRGTIVGVQKLTDPNPVRHFSIAGKADMYYDVLFDQPFNEGSSIPNVVEKSLFKVSELHLVNISYGQHKFKSEISSTTTGGGSGIVDEPTKTEHKKQTPTAANADFTWEMLRNQPPQKDNLLESFIESSAAVAAVSTNEMNNIGDKLCQLKVDPNTLPKPPTNWCSTTPKKAAEVSAEKDVLPSQPKLEQPQYRQQQQQQQQQRPQQRAGSSKRGPNGPQNIGPPGHGAFIPLQAARKQIKSKQLPAANEAAATVSTAQRTPPPSKQENTPSSSDGRKAVPATKKNVVMPLHKRTSRIAARFDGETS